MNLLKISATKILLLSILFGSNLGTISLLWAAENTTNPLEITTTDPLLPNPPIERPLTPLERFRLEQALEEFNSQAAAELEAGKTKEAFEIWYRELRLRRELGVLTEIEALTRVGTIAWQNNLPLDYQNIIERLEKIAQVKEEKESLTPDLLEALGKAHLQINNLKSALRVYQKILANARQSNDIAKIKKTLISLGELYLNSFQDDDAVAIYQELLKIDNTPQQELSYLETLADIYQQDNNLEAALAIQKQLEEIYQQNQQLEKLSRLKLAIANNHNTQQQVEQASHKYLEAFNLAQSQQHFALASESLEKLAQMYQSYGQTSLSLLVYQDLLKLQIRYKNSYGLMNTYQQIGAIYLQQQQYNQALDNFNLALIHGQEIGYNQEFLQQQINQLQEQINQ